MQNTTDNNGQHHYDPPHDYGQAEQFDGEASQPIESSIDESFANAQLGQQPFTELPREEQCAAVEALIFASEEPLSTKALYDLLIAPSLPQPPKEKNGKPSKSVVNSTNGKTNGTHTNGNGTEHLHSADELYDVTVEVARLEVAPPEGLAPLTTIAVEVGEDLLPDDTKESASAMHLVAQENPEEQGFQHIEELIEELNRDFEATGRAFEIVHVASAAGSTGYQFATRARHGELIARLVKSKSKKRLSQAALETLAIVAYRQPVAKPELEVIRGVNSGEIINKLLEKNLVTIVGRSEAIGKPLLYGTTDEFLRLFGLQSLDGLPKPRELEELMGDRADILEAFQTANDAAQMAIMGTKNPLKNVAVTVVTIPDSSMDYE